MSAFSSEKLIPVTVPDLMEVADDVTAHFKERGYDTVRVAVSDGGHEIDITQGGVFKKALGLRTALKIEILPQPTGTLVRAGVGIFGKQAVPFMIAMLVTWPVLLTQVWGLVNQAGLDDEAIKVAELTLNRLHRLAGSPPPNGAYCHRCGHRRPREALFCPNCGGEQQAAG